VKKNARLIEHNVEVMEKQERITVVTLLCVLPILSAIELFQNHFGHIYYWLGLIGVALLILITFYIWNHLTLGISIFIQFMMAGILIARHALASMAKGVELLSGPAPRFQYGLINFVDGVVILLILCHIGIITTHLTIRRRDMKEQKKLVHEIKTVDM